MAKVSAERYLVPKVVGLSIALAVGYGLIQDQITIRICPEYFTVWHPNPLQIDNITLLALYWGVAATWWVGLILGVIIGAIASEGGMPRATFCEVRKRLVRLMLAAAVCTITAGIVAEVTGFTVSPRIAGPAILRLNAAELHAFSVDWAAHNMAYLSAFMGAVVVAFLTWLSRLSAMTGNSTVP